MKNLIQKTASPKAVEITRKWYLIDLKGKTLGRAATKIANILRGKNKTNYSEHLDCGDYVIVVNAAEVKLTGSKETQKTYYSHSRFPGGLKSITADKLREKKPEMIIELAVEGMIPKNKLRKNIMKKMKIFAGPDHNLEAQQPETLEI